jgi:hypothetical protein
MNSSICFLSRRIKDSGLPTGLTVPMAEGYACLEGNAFVRGLFSISENTSVLVEMDFLVRCGKVLIIAPNGVATVDVGEYERERKKQSQKPRN